MAPERDNKVFSEKQTENRKPKTAKKNYNCFFYVVFELIKLKLQI
jgi:hypothetical protein